MNGDKNNVTHDDHDREILAALRRIEDRFDEFAKVYLDARFPYGRPVDRWARRGNRG